MVDLVLDSDWTDDQASASDLFLELQSVGREQTEETHDEYSPTWIYTN